ncbi:hypothetical protein BTJ39_05095 [Izhakiella australiensis]|uniref:Uncharacterized protein n=1 Tax=Izhakiella australiensis TaxID=1926881 RepID=A0A1S8YQA8_9GAMM|nr:hypothetical protein [Izhakiella australiensis]OON41341.1 hypothetical protein BTJ39_05095 [Izhakiella australiensis]
MRIPRYLVIALAVTGVIVVASQFYDRPTEVAPVARALKPTRSVTPGAAAARQAEAPHEIIDLFPVPEVLKPASAAQKPPPPKKVEPPFTFQVMGAWWKEGKRIVIISDGIQSLLLCQRCRAANVIRPGDNITPEWQLRALADDHLEVEWLPQKLLKRIELGDLKSEPTR